jgi:hypothetical protein
MGRSILYAFRVACGIGVRYALSPAGEQLEIRVQKDKKKMKIKILILKKFV